MCSRADARLGVGAAVRTGTAVRDVGRRRASFPALIGGRGDVKCRGVRVGSGDAPSGSPIVGEDLSEKAWLNRNENIQPFSFWKTKFEPEPSTPEPLAKEALRLAGTKISLKTKFVKREADLFES